MTVKKFAQVWTLHNLGHCRGRAGWYWHGPGNDLRIPHTVFRCGWADFAPNAAGRFMISSPRFRLP